MIRLMNAPKTIWKLLNLFVKTVNRARNAVNKSNMAAGALKCGVLPAKLLGIGTQERLSQAALFIIHSITNGSGEQVEVFHAILQMFLVAVIHMHGIWYDIPKE